MNRAQSRGKQWYFLKIYYKQNQLSGKNWYFLKVYYKQNFRVYCTYFSLSPLQAGVQRTLMMRTRDSADQFASLMPNPRRVPRLPSENSDFAQIVVNRVIPPRLTIPSSVGRDQVAPLRALTGTRDNGFYHFFPNHDSIVSMDFTISPHCSCDVYWWSPDTLIHWQSSWSHISKGVFYLMLQFTTLILLCSYNFKLIMVVRICIVKETMLQMSLIRDDLCKIRRFLVVMTCVVLCRDSAAHVGRSPWPATSKASGLSSTESCSHSPNKVSVYSYSRLL